MFARSAVVLGSVMLAAFALGCGSPSDGVGQNGGRASGSPNDPNGQPSGTTPVGSDETTTQPGDESGEGPSTPTCDAPLPAIPSGWKATTLTDFSVSTPSEWKLGYSYDKVMERSSIEFEGAVSSDGTIVNATEFGDLHSLEAWEKLTNMVIKGKNGTTGCVLTTTPVKYGCDDAIIPVVTCPNRPTHPVGSAMVVLHEGAIYSLGCSSLNPTDSAACASFVGSLRFTK